MSKKKEVKTKSKVELMDSNTGEVVESDSALSTRRVSALEFIPDEQLQNAVDVASEIDVDELEAEQNDYWKPEKEGDSVTGVFIGMEPQLDKEGHPNGRVQALLAVPHKDTGKAFPLRFSASTALRREFTKRVSGKPDASRICRIEYTGRTQTSNGFGFKTFQVTWLKEKSK